MKGLSFVVYLCVTTCLAEFHNVLKRDVSHLLNATSGSQYKTHEPHHDSHLINDSKQRSQGGRSLQYGSGPTRSNLPPHPSRTYLPAEEGYPKANPQSYSSSQYSGHSLNSQSTLNFPSQSGQIYHESQSYSGLSSVRNAQNPSLPQSFSYSTRHSAPSQYDQQNIGSRYEHTQSSGSYQRAGHSSSSFASQQGFGQTHGHQSYGQNNLFDQQGYGQSSQRNFNTHGYNGNNLNAGLQASGQRNLFGQQSYNQGHHGMSPSDNYQRNQFQNQLFSNSRDSRLHNPGSYASQGFQGAQGQHGISSFGAETGVSAIKRDYDFGYDVSAHESGTEFNHEESRRDGRAKGKYEVVLPDGRRQIVEYEADETGFHPKVTYQDQGRSQINPLSQQNVNTVITDLLNNDVKRSRDPTGQYGSQGYQYGRQNQYGRSLSSTDQFENNQQYNAKNNFGQSNQFGDHSQQGPDGFLPPHTHGLHYSQPYSKNRPQGPNSLH